MARAATRSEQSNEAEAEAAFGPVDILVNNAGIAPIGLPLVELDPHSFDTVIAINLTGVFNGVSAFAGEMGQRGRGHIVNTASLAGLTINQPGLGGYAVAKFGVVALSEQLRVELAPDDVGVSVLCPGFVPTNLHRNTTRITGDSGGGSSMAVPPVEMDAREIGEIVADAIARDLPYIITHPGSWPRVESRFYGLREAFSVAAADRAQAPQA